MSKLGFYGWIRENVRRAVLLGFSDAVEQLGLPNEKDEVSPQLLAVLQPAKPLLMAEGPVKPAPAGGGRKRLGQTLEQIQQRAASQSPTPSNET
ncbi:MAG: hypothetical protein B7Z73_17410 [Planctomycetia bacterium 21-64-5]|nr:MAG: hypothetical protein B7Z73_17410 [Planctomycetia bacterium 21-64-5]